MFPTIGDDFQNHKHDKMIWPPITVATVYRVLFLLLSPTESGKHGKCHYTVA